MNIKELIGPFIAVGILLGGAVYEVMLLAQDAMHPAIIGMCLVFRAIALVAIFMKTEFSDTLGIQFEWAVKGILAGVSIQALHFIGGTDIVLRPIRHIQHFL